MKFSELTWNVNRTPIPCREKLQADGTTLRFSELYRVIFKRFRDAWMTVALCLVTAAESDIPRVVPTDPKAIRAQAASLVPPAL